MASRGAPAAEPPPAAAPPEVALRFLLFGSALTAVMVMVTSKQTLEGLPAAKFSNAPATIYFVAALSVAGLYGIITTLCALLKPASYPKVSSHFVIFDLVLLGVVAAAAGSAGAIAYTSLKGNSHLGWGKICNVYGKFCRYVGVSILISLFTSVLLLLLVLLSFSSLLKKIPK